MNKRMSSTVAMLTLLAAGVVAQEPAAKPVKLPGTPVRLQVVLSRYQGERKIGSLPYTLMGSANGELMALSAGIMVPVRYEGKDYTGNVVYKGIGSNLECNTDALEGGSFKVSCKIENSSVYTDPVASGARAPLGATQPPVLSQVKAQAILVLRDGQSAQYATVTDPVSGEVLKIDVTLAVLK